MTMHLRNARVLERRVHYLRHQLWNYQTRKDYGVEGLDSQIAVTLRLLQNAEERLADYRLVASA